jgi:hypothetical protein
MCSRGCRSGYGQDSEMGGYSDPERKDNLIHEALNKTTIGPVRADFLRLCKAVEL